MENLDGSKINLFNREVLEISAVHNVLFYDEAEILMETASGHLLIKGEGLHITTLNLEEGRIVAEGYVQRIEYVEDKGAKLKKKGKGVLSKLLR